MTLPGAIDARAVGTAHMQCGLALMKASDTASATAALRHFDRALELRRRLPCDAPRDVFALAAASMNRAEALLVLGTGPHLERALESLTAAVVLLETLPRDDDRRVPQRLAIALQNRALTRGRLGRDTWMMARDLFRALDLLQTLPRSTGCVDDQQLAAVWVNIGIAQLLEPTDDAWQRAVESAREAMRVIGGREWTDPKMAEIGLRARYLCCQATARVLAARRDVAGALVPVAADAVSSALMLIAVWEQRGSSALASLASEMRECGRRLSGCQLSSPHGKPAPLPRPA